MAKAASVLNRLLGKKIVFNGKFGYGLPQLQALAEAQQGIVEEDVSASTDYLVLADVSAGKTIQKKVMSLNAKGASIQVLDCNAFESQFAPSDEEVLALIKSGAKSADAFNKAVPQSVYTYRPNNAATRSIAGENFDGIDLTGFNFHDFAFASCSFADARLGISFQSACKCDFTGASANGVNFGDVKESVFKNASLEQATFEADIDHANFTSAKLPKASFQRHYPGTAKRTAIPGLVFRNATLTGARLVDFRAASPDFEGSDCSSADFGGAQLDNANFRKATARDANLMDAKLTSADFTGADLRGANFAGADLGGAKFDGADVTGCNFRMAKIGSATLAKARGYNPDAAVGTVGHALKELDSLVKKAKRINFTVRVKSDQKAEGIEVGIDSSGLTYGWPMRLPYDLGYRHSPTRKAHTFSDAMLQLADVVGHRAVRYETVDVQSTKSPTAGKELRDLVINGIAEAFAQPVPDADALAKATKDYREEIREQGSADRERREKAKIAAEKAKAKEVKQAEKKIEKAVGKVTDIATFLKALELRADKQKIDKATKMLKASGFQLYNDIADTYMSGVVKSQTDPDLVYACRIEDGGKYACCTQNLNICGGLRGSICKHLLVLIIGLVKAGELDPSTIDAWVAKSQHAKPELDKEIMGEIFIRYKGAEAGEVDWRPTETLPEDYYAL